MRTSKTQKRWSAQGAEALNLEAAVKQEAEAEARAQAVITREAAAQTEVVASETAQEATQSLALQRNAHAPHAISTKGTHAQRVQLASSRMLWLLLR